MNTLKVDYKLHNRFVKRLNAYQHGRHNRRYPDCLMLGKNRKGIIRNAVPLPTNGGCYEMAHIIPDEISIGMTKLIKKGLIPCGIIRIGWFDRGGTHRVGSARNEISRMGDGGLFITFSKERVDVLYVKRGTQYRQDETLVYGLVK
jgi:hypothetical protein